MSDIVKNATGHCCGWRIHAERNKGDPLSHRYFARKCEELHAIEDQTASQQPKENTMATKKKTTTTKKTAGQQPKENTMATKKKTTTTKKTAAKKATKAKANPVIPKTKVCPQCEVRRNASSFYKDKSKADGLMSWCKECLKAHYAAKRAEVAGE